MDREYDDLVQLEDLNGAAYVIANVGEVEEDLSDLYTLLPPAHMEPEGLRFPFNEYAATVPAARRLEPLRYISQVFWLNFIKLHSEVPKYQGQVQHAAAVAYLRSLAVREGLVNPDADAAANYCQYNLCRRVEGPEEQIFGHPEWYAAVRTATIATHGEGYTIAQFRAHYSGGRGTAAPGVNPIRYRQKPILSENEKKLLRLQFTDIVCTVAFMFRTRAHHWTQDMDASYKRIWKGCVKSEGRETPLADWESCGRYLCKAIFPAVLDAFWGKSIEESKCSAKLAIRWDAAAAGSASIVALRRGLDDLKTAFPVIEEKLGDSIKVLEEQEDKLRGDRWGPSINSRYYGVRANRIDERGLAPLAATILAALNQFVENSPLAKSKALSRLASSAPIVGAVLASILQRVSAHDSVVYSYIPSDVKSIVLK